MGQIRGYKKNCAWLEHKLYVVRKNDLYVVKKGLPRREHIFVGHDNRTTAGIKDCGRANMRFRKTFFDFGQCRWLCCVLVSSF